MEDGFSNSTVDNYLWVKKYRPTKIEDLKLPDDYMKDFQKFIAYKQIPHLLLYGPPGGGKTNVAEILCSRNGIFKHPDDNVLEINGSAQGSRGIGFVSNNIEPFLKHPPAGDDPLKVVFIDEGDELCFEGDVEVKVIEDNQIIHKRIEDLDNNENIKVLSLDLDTNLVEVDDANYVNSGHANMYEVELDDGSTISCSEDHPFFILDDNDNLIEKKLKELENCNRITSINQLKNYQIEEKTIKSIKFKGKRKAHNLSVNKNKNFILANGLITHNTSQAFSALKNPINKYSDHSRFIITCNTVSKLPDAIQSRFEQGSYLFKQVPMNYVQEHCEYILNNEGIDYKSDNLKYLINNLYPDIRKIISRLQKCSYGGKLQIGSEDVKTKENQVISNVIQIIDFMNNNEKSKIGNVIQNISDLVDDPALEYSTIYKNLFYNSKIKNPGVKVKINQYANTHNSCLSPSMHFMSLVFSILEVLKEYGK